MAYDGSIIIETGIDTGGFESGLAEIEGLAAQALAACGVEMTNRLAEGMAHGKPAIENSALGLGQAAAQNVAAATGQMTDAGGRLAEGLWAGIQAANGWLGGKIRDWCAGIVQGIRDALGIASPAKVMADEIGRWMPPGIALGFKAALPDAQREMAKQLQAMTMAVRDGAAFSPVGSAGAALPRADAGGGSVVLNQTVYTHNSLSPYELAVEAEAFAERERWRIR